MPKNEEATAEEQVAEAEEAEAKEEEKKEEKPKVPKIPARHPNWRPVMFSRSTAMFTIPTAVRDSADLVKIKEADLGALVEWDNKRGLITIKPGYKKDGKKA